MNCACMSVAKPGYGAVRTLTALRPRSPISIAIQSEPVVDPRTGLAQLVERGIEGFGAASAEPHVAAGRRGGARG